jgi:serine/threonine-protein kinase
VAEGTLDKPTIVGRYVLDGEVASGGMATVYHGHRTDEAPPGTTVAIKRVHPHLAKDKRFASMFIDEARLVSRITHANVIRTLDIIASDSECMLVMEYVHGESLGRLLRLCDDQRARPPLDILSAILCGALEGLQASHDATNAAGAPLNIVHRDISPQNIMVGADGVPRVLDFGVAKAAGSLHVTRDGEIKGKLAYMSPEQVSAKALDRRTDVYAAGVVLWEAVTMLPLFDGENEAAIIASVLRQEIAVPSTIVPGLPPGLDDVVMRSLAADREARFSTAREMARALEAVIPRADVQRVAAWVDHLSGPALRERAALVQKRASGAAPATATEKTSGVTEVFFTTGAKNAGEAAANASVAIQRTMTTVDAGLRDATRYLPLTVRGPVYKHRWWFAGGALTLFVLFLVWAFKPTPRPEAGIFASPDGVVSH